MGGKTKDPGFYPFHYVLEGDTWEDGEAFQRLCASVIDALPATAGEGVHGLVLDGSATNGNLDDNALAVRSRPLQVIADEENESEVAGFLRKLIGLILGATAKITVVMEANHVDPAYRDMYYAHYSRKFHDTDRNVLRLSFFDGELSVHDMYMMCEGPQQFPSDSDPVSGRRECEAGDSVARRFIGCCVVGSFGGGYIGRTLIDPSYILDRDAEVRLSRYPLNVWGRLMNVNAFPYRKQDGEVMRCAEVTLLNLMCYYSNEYQDYHQVLPSEILEHESLYSSERVVPSHGLGYDTMSRILTDFRFHPRLYNVDNYAKSIRLASGLTKQDVFRRTLHWYVASGIPVAVNVAKRDAMSSSHSLICIGYEDVHACEGGPDIDEKALAKAERFHVLSEDGGVDRSAVIILSADIERQFVVVDDGQMPYEMKPFERLSRFSNMECVNYLVPLHRSMALDAMDAYSTASAILSNPAIGLLGWGADSVKDNETFVMSIFLSSVRGYKRARMQHERKEGREAFVAMYQQMVLPHFVWVVELMRKESYCSADRRVMAELVLDATNGTDGGAIDKVILMRYPRRIYFRDQSGQGHFFEIQGDGEDAMVPYADNLERIESRACQNKKRQKM